MQMANSRSSFRVTPRVLFTLFFLVLFAVGFLLAWNWPFAARLFPSLASGLGIALSLVQLLRELSGWEHEEKNVAKGTQMDESFSLTVDHRTDMIRTGVFFLTLMGMSLAIWLFGMVIALPVVMFLYAHFQARESWLSAALVGLGFFVTVWVLFEQILRISWGQGVIVRMFF